MTQQGKKSPECGICGSINGLSFAFLTERPLEEDEAYVPDEPYIICRDHWQELVDSDEYYVRTIAPVPNGRGGFSRTSDGQGSEIIYDRDEGDGCWIQFDPDAEVDLEDGEEPKRDTNE